ncbi:MAG: hypothetical protein CTY34_13065 [Methylobacter sp.]|nr:MAG: hypothetical protein CTY34_13065 [Methylobacter sp.]PPD23381.1 MAG: hypothetical protein CTY24_04585 [Methylobacter sp.]
MIFKLLLILFYSGQAQPEIDFRSSRAMQPDLVLEELAAVKLSQPDLLMQPNVYFYQDYAVVTAGLCKITGSLF